MNTPLDRRGLMKNALAALLLARTSPLLQASPASAGPQPPATPRIPVTLQQLGRTRVDEFAWIKDPDFRAVWADPSKLHANIRAHLAAENAYTDDVLAPTRDLQAQLFADMRSYSGAEAPAPPTPDGDFVYYTRFAPGAEYPIYARRSRRKQGPEEILLDGDERGRGKKYLLIPHAAHSPDHHFFAWAEDETGSERFTIRIRDLKNGRLLGSVIEGAFGLGIFSPDSQHFYWVWRSENSRPTKVFRRAVQGGPDVLMYEEHDPGMFMTLSRLRSNAYVVIHVYNADTSEVRLIPAADPTAAPLLVEPRKPGLFYELEHWHDQFVVRTNADGALNFKLMWASEHAPGRASWRDFVAAREDRSIEAMLAFEDYFVRRERMDANPQLIVTDRATKVDRTLKFGEVAYAAEWEPLSEYGSAILRLKFQSPRLAPRWYEHDMATNRRSLLSETTVPGGFKASRYAVLRLFATAGDGERVPITLLMRRDTPLDGSAPLLLYGYGSYGYSTEAEFSVAALSLVDRGWIYAIAHARGGAEKGWTWYLQARRTHKPLTFTDFIACADHLVAQRYTRPGRIVAYGLSAGGLLVGAVANLRPTLWGALIAQAPFVDMLNTMSDTEHPLVPLTHPDWGDPLVDTVAYDAIAGFSPYENVHAAPYPPILATGSVPDDRVGYWEPAKWVAKVRQESTSGAPALLKVAMQGGHMGAAGRFEALKQYALFWAFAIWALREEHHAHVS